MIWKSIFNFFGKERKVYLDPKGNHYHLDHILSSLNQEYFAGKLDVHITWSHYRRKKARRRIILGSYHFHQKIIRINRFLDRPEIPDYFVSYVVYHEALHHLFPPVKGSKGKRSIHHLDFKTEEKKFKYYEVSQEFCKNLFGKTSPL